MSNGTTEQPLTGRPRWILHLQAQFWRVLMGIGMILHRLAPPRPPKPTFSRTIPTTIAPRKGNITLHFYTPLGYQNRVRIRGKTYPVVVNFHGGGFTLGSAIDDARWCKAVVDEVGAVCVSVDYRLAPENPFPTAVEDGCDAILYLAQHAHEFHIDLDKVAVSGFSSGANMAFTVPLRLQEEVLLEHTGVPSTTSTVSLLQKAMSAGRTLVNVQQEIKLKAVVAWYPPTDYTKTRAERRATCTQTDHQLPAIFTNLFDDSYLQPPTMDMSNPYLSPGVAPDFMLNGLPDDIILYTCEWDMLVEEAERMRDRLRNEVHKNVIYHMIPGVPHGWDKAPNPLKTTPGVKDWYTQACKELKRIFKDPVEEEPPKRRFSISAFAEERRSKKRASMDIEAARGSIDMGSPKSPKSPDGRRRLSLGEFAIERAERKSMQVNREDLTIEEEELGAEPSSSSSRQAL